MQRFAGEAYINEDYFLEDKTSDIRLIAVLTFQSTISRAATVFHTQQSQQ